LKFEVINGSISATNSAQDLIRFQFDYRFLRPDLWVHLAGGNEAWERLVIQGGAELNYPRGAFTHYGSDKPLPFPGLPALQRAWSRFFSATAAGDNSQASPFFRDASNYSLTETFFLNLRMSKASVEAMGGKYLFVLQPRPIALMPEESAEAADSIFSPQYIASARKLLDQFYRELKGRLRSSEIHWVDGEEILKREYHLAFLEERLLSATGAAAFSRELAKTIGPIVTSFKARQQLAGSKRSNIYRSRGQSRD
jgi:hypothetical protein